MKLNKLSVMAMTIFTLSSTSVMAAGTSGTITFEGDIRSPTCTVLMNGVPGNDGTITLNDVNSTDIDKSGKTANSAVKLKLNQCSTVPNTRSVFATFTGNTNSINKAGQIINQASSDSAGNVVLEMLDSSGNKLDLATARPEIVLNSNEGEFEYSVQYKRIEDDKPVIPGAFNSKISYEISYQ
ncbi:fimbrial protein [Xenorhabdus koppenhoeferi]|uniref:Pilin (Type 1 fimbria component protein) n=1 Tax=Xenorhabdus koppenhoeferi TaxID=351659 RepID=A0A1I7EY86_9GAMM|nr:fimbrial protein [Xenorhabdus koppenhoeferi]SFU28867.1 Pilin (type 1 fimbria component protein) [Xenorhabdus koppenhoeferi]